MLRLCTSASVAPCSSHTSNWTNCAPGSAATHRCSGWPSILSRRVFLCSIWVPAPKTQRIWSCTLCGNSWPPFCLPLFTSDGLNVYFYALPSPFWTMARGSSATVESAPVAGGGGLDLRPSEKSYRRRKLVWVTHVMRLGTGAALKGARPRMGFSGRLNTAFIERVNLTVRQGVAALARRTWATPNRLHSSWLIFNGGAPTLIVCVPTHHYG
jgi:hypothetical protein